MKIIERPGKVIAQCEDCEWTTASTGPKAAQRVAKLAAAHVEQRHLPAGA